jgi:hypothetical protein
MCSGIEEIKKMCRTFSEAGGPSKPGVDMGEDEKPEEMSEEPEEMSDDAEEMSGDEEAAEMGELTIKHDEEGKMARRRMSRNSRSAPVANLAAENARLKAKFARFERELRVERFTRAVEDLRQDGYNIRDEQVPGLVQQLERSDDPVGLIEAWRELFARDPIGRRIDMSRAALPKGDIGLEDVSRLVREHAGKPEAFAAAVNARLGARR